MRNDGGSEVCGRRPTVCTTPHSGHVICIIRPIVAGDESLPVVDPSVFWDTYSATKSQAERLVLEANGTSLPPPMQSSSASPSRLRPLRPRHPPPPATAALRTCVIRPAGIYGPGECRHLPRVVSMLRSGLFRFIFDVPGSRTDWLHVENLVQVSICLSPLSTT